MSRTPAVQAALVRSWPLASAMGALHALTLVPLWIAIPTPALAAALTVLLCVHAVWTIRMHALLTGRGAVSALAVESALRCALTLRDGRRIVGVVDASTVVTGSLAIIALRIDQPGSRIRRFRRVIVVAGMLGDDEFRRLRVALKWGGRETSRSGSRAALRP